jgi:hypothetical protein
MKLILLIAISINLFIINLSSMCQVKKNKHIIKIEYFQTDIRLPPKGCIVTLLNFQDSKGRLLKIKYSKKQKLNIYNASITNIDLYDPINGQYNVRIYYTVAGPNPNENQKTINITFTDEKSVLKLILNHMAYLTSYQRNKETNERVLSLFNNAKKLCKENTLQRLTTIEKEVENLKTNEFDVKIIKSFKSVIGGLKG